VRAGNQHSLFLHASGRVSAFGSDSKVHAAEDVQAIGYSWNRSYLRSTRTGQFSAGANAHGHGQLCRKGAVLGPVDVPDTLRVGDFACGSEHVLCVLDSEGLAEVWGWRRNENGNLAIGSLNDVKALARIWPPFPAKAEEKTAEAVGVLARCETSWIAVSLPTLDRSSGRAIGKPGPAIQ
jgi:protein ATS1